jgi:hypothetical protein
VDDSRDKAERTTRLLTLAARALSSGVAAFWLYVGIGYAIKSHTQWSLQALGMTVLIAGTAGCAVFAYSSAGLGGLLMLLCGATHGITTYWTAESGKLPSAVITGGPFILAGLLFLSSWSRSRGGAEAPKPTEGDVS